MDFVSLCTWVVHPALVGPLLLAVSPGIMVGVAGCLLLRRGLQVSEPGFSFDLLRAPPRAHARTLARAQITLGAAASLLGAFMVSRSFGHLLISLRSF